MRNSSLFRNPILTRFCSMMDSFGPDLSSKNSPKSPSFYQSTASFPAGISTLLRISSFIPFSMALICSSSFLIWKEEEKNNLQRKNSISISRWEVRERRKSWRKCRRNIRPFLWILQISRVRLLFRSSQFSRRPLSRVNLSQSSPKVNKKRVERVMTELSTRECSIGWSSGCASPRWNIPSINW